MTQRLEAQGSKDNNANGIWDDGSDHDDVTRISIRGDSHVIEYIRFDYIKSGQPKYGTFHRVTVSGCTHTFEIDHLKGEQLESVEGYYEPKLDAILGLQFKTNLRISELIGYGTNCTKFSLSVDGKKIIGFHGCSYSKLTSLGAYFNRITPNRLEAKGGKGGRVWNDGDDHESVTNIYVRGGYEGIQYIKFDYVKNGQQKFGSIHGVRGRGFTEQFAINHLENEYLVSVEGYYDDGEFGVLQGLQFKTNIKTSELMGDDKGRKFSLAANGKKIIGFHGCAGNNLNSLGAYFTTSPFTKLEYRGDSTTGVLWDDGTFEGIKKVCVFYDDTYVRCLKTEYENWGKVKMLEHGFISGQKGEFLVDYPNEFITSVEGTLKTTSYTWVASLSFKTSKGRTSPTFGSMINNKFVLERKGYALVGFHGRSDGAIGAIGAYFFLLPPPSDAERLEAQGGSGGDSWDDGSFNGIRNIYIGHNEMGIAFVRFLYDNENHAVVGDNHGSTTFLGIDEFELEYPCEYLISVEGSYDVVNGSESKVISMLRFKTNMRTSQVFGLETPSNFIIEKECHKIVGFHGKVSNMLHQIGVYVMPIKE